MEGDSDRFFENVLFRVLRISGMVSWVKGTGDISRISGRRRLYCGLVFAFFLYWKANYCVFQVLFPQKTLFGSAMMNACSYGIPSAILLKVALIILNAKAICSFENRIHWLSRRIDVPEKKTFSEKHIFYLLSSELCCLFVALVLTYATDNFDSYGHCIWAYVSVSLYGVLCDLPFIIYVVKICTAFDGINSCLIKWTVGDRRTFTIENVRLLHRFHFEVTEQVYALNKAFEGGVVSAVLEEFFFFIVITIFRLVGAVSGFKLLDLVCWFILALSKLIFRLQVCSGTGRQSGVGWAGNGPRNTSLPPLLYKK